MMSTTTPRNRLLWTALAVGLAGLVAWRIFAAQDPAKRLRQIAPRIGADRIEAPLTDAQRAYALERAGSTAQGPAATVPFADLLAQVAPKPGTVVFVNFWATWCKPCVQEMPTMMELARRMRDEGRDFVMVAVSYDDDWAAVSDFFARLVGNPRPAELVLARDPAPDSPTSLRMSLGTRQIPESYVLRDGVVLARFVNLREWTQPEIVEYFQLLTEIPRGAPRP